MTTDIEFIKLDVQGRIAQIASGLLTADPQLSTHLSAIHTALITYEELVHLLDDTEIRTLIAGQCKHVNVELVKEITKSSKATISKRIPKTSVDDL